MLKLSRHNFYSVLRHYVTAGSVQYRPLEMNTELDSRFEWKRLRYDDYNQLKILVVNFYSPKEPTRHMMGLKQGDIDNIDAFRIKNKLREEGTFGIGIVEKVSKQIIVAGLDSIKPSIFPPPLTRNNVSPLAYSDLLTTIEPFKEDIPEFVKSTKMYYMTMLVVHPNFRRMNFATQMYKAREETAAKLSCKYMLGAASSYYSQRALERNGFIRYSEVKYTDYIDSNSGLNPFIKPSPPHTHMRAYYKEVPSKNNYKEQY